MEGVEFQDKTGRVIINYPKGHIKNGEAKNAAGRTSFTYKQTVRMFKNARNAAIDKKLIGADVSPSYFVECLLYNAPDGLFSTGRQTTFSSVHDYLWSKLTLDTAKCQNEQILLFGNTPEQWKKDNAVAFLDGLARLWNNWQYAPPLRYRFR